MLFHRKWLLLILCLTCCALLTGCYTDNDPWPNADNLSAMAITPTPSPTAAPAASPTPVPTEIPQTAAPESLPEDAVDVSPNFNG